MRAFTTIPLIAFAAAFLAACEGPSNSQPRANSPEVVEQARIRVLGQLSALDTGSQEMIKTNAPRIEYVGAPFGGSYYFCWMISSNRTAVLGAFSSLKNLSERPVWIREAVSASHY